MTHRSRPPRSSLPRLTSLLFNFNNSYTKVAWIFLVVFCLSGCSPLIKAGQTQVTEKVRLEPGESAGQTFVAPYDGLAGVDIYLQQASAGQVLSFQLKQSSQAQEILRQTEITVPADRREGYLSVNFDGLPSSAQQSYYFSIQNIAGPALILGASSPESYLMGSAYRQETPLPKQHSFRLQYNRALALQGLLGEALRWGLWILGGAFLFILPGWGLLKLSVRTWERLSWAEKLGLSAGVGLAVYPVLFSLMALIPLRLGVLFAWLPPVVGIFLLLVTHGKKTNPNYPPRADLIPQFALVLILALIFGARFWAIRNLAAPMWGDSYQHAVITQRILEEKGLFESWLPYAPYQSLTTHFGFSAISAVFAWLSGMSALPATLVTGQLLNGLAALTLYPLAVQVSGKRQWAGIGAVLVAGLLSPFPGYYVNWGRYAQLAGLAILPVALWLLWNLLEGSLPKPRLAEQPGRGRPLGSIALGEILLLGVTVAGMLLSYYRMPFYFIAFTAGWLTFAVFTLLRRDAAAWKAFLVPGGLAGLASLVFLLPWLPRLFGTSLAGALEAGVVRTSALQAVHQDYAVWQFWQTYLPAGIALLALAGLLLAVFRRQWPILGMALGSVILSLLKAGALVRLPGANMMQSFAVLISLYLPAAVISGWLVGELAGWMEKRRPRLVWVVVGVALLLEGLWGANQQRSLADPNQFALVTQPDLQAAQWIRSNVKPDAVFLVEGFLINGDSSLVGADAGWWLPLLAGRANTMPPQYALLNERPVEPGYNQRMLDLVKTVRDRGIGAAETTALLCREGITHAYIGQRQGKVGFGASQLFSAEAISARAGFYLIYQQDLVRIFELDRSACPND